MFGLIPFNGSLKEDICMYFPYGPLLNEVPCWRQSWIMGRLQSNNTWSAPHEKHSYHVCAIPFSGFLEVQNVKNQQRRRMPSDENSSLGP